MSRIDADEAAKTLELLTQIGEAQMEFADDRHPAMSAVA